MKFQRLLSLTRQAIDAYHMIDENDRIAVGISGGKDSLALLYALNGLMKFYPKKFSIVGITVDLGLGHLSLESVQLLCDKLSIPYFVVTTDIGNILFDIRKESNPCSLCAKMRKGALNLKAKELGCNKIAYAHHKDDVIETMLLSLLYEGRFHVFSPNTYLDRMDLSVIRPMIYVSESEVIGFQNKYNLPESKNPCHLDGHTKREYAKNLVKQLEQENPGAKTCMFHAILEGNIDGWKKRGDLL